MHSERSTLLFFASVKPQGLSNKRLKERIFDYSMALELLAEYALNLGIKLKVLENTLGSIEIWKDSGLYYEENIEFDFLPDNSGAVNKGIGELDMAKRATEKWKLDQYEKVIWFSGRHLLTTENTLKIILNSQADVTVTNPDFYFPGEGKIQSEKVGLLNDMLFSMTSQFFLEYLAFFKSNRNEMIRKSIGSEQLLFQFLDQRRPKMDSMIQLGILRRENTRKLRWIETSKWHFC